MIAEKRMSPAGNGTHSEDSVGDRSEIHLNPDSGHRLTTRELVTEVLADRRDPSELPPGLWSLWADGFECGAAKVSARLALAEAERDSLYYALYNDDDVKRGHQELLTAFTVALNRASTAEQWAELDRIAAERAEAQRG